MNGGDGSREPVPVENRFRLLRSSSTPLAFALNNILIGAFASMSLAKTRTSHCGVSLLCQRRERSWQSQTIRKKTEMVQSAA